MDEYNDPIREAIEHAILEEADGLKQLPIGSDERKKSADCFATFCKVYHEDCRLGGQLLKDQEEMELAKKKFAEDSTRQDRRLELEEAAHDKAVKWYNQPIAEKLLVCGFSGLTLLAGMKINSGMTPLKNAIEKYIFFIKPKI